MPMALKSGDWGGRNTSRAQTFSMASRTLLILWRGRLSMTIMSAGVMLGRENLLGSGKEGRTVHLAVEQNPRSPPAQSQAGGEGAGLPMHVRHGRPT